MSVGACYRLTWKYSLVSSGLSHAVQYSRDGDKARHKMQARESGNHLEAVEGLQSYRQLGTLLVHLRAEHSRHLVKKQLEGRKPRRQNKSSIDKSVRERKPRGQSGEISTVSLRGFQKNFGRTFSTILVVIPVPLGYHIATLRRSHKIGSRCDISQQLVH